LNQWGAKFGNRKCGVPDEDALLFEGGDSVADDFDGVFGDGGTDGGMHFV
jgi:hypothetical protein